ncbi:MAG: hypothetical protein RhofKO_40790 [Rhodothermales bacterium]
MERMPYYALAVPERWEGFLQLQARSVKQQHRIDVSERKTPLPEVRAVAWRAGARSGLPVRRWRGPQAFQAFAGAASLAKGAFAAQRKRFEYHHAIDLRQDTFLRR